MLQWQEYCYTKSYCKLRSVCVVCGGPHSSAECSTVKSDANSKKCSNCGGNHTTNYRGCPYLELKSKSTSKIRKTVPSISSASSYSKEKPQLNANATSYPLSYANILKSNADIEFQPNVPVQSQSQNLESTIHSLTQFMAQFMTTMQNLMQEMIKTQNHMMQMFMSKK